MKTMVCEDLKDLLPLHAVDLLEAPQAAAVGAHLQSGCPRCAAEMAALRETLGLLPFALPPEEPSEMARARLLAAARRERSTSALPSRLPAWSWGAAAAAAAVLITAIVTARGVARRYEDQIAVLQTEIGQQREELVSLRRQVEQARDSILLVSSPAVRVIDLAGQGVEARASARVFWDQQRNLWRLYASNLPAPEAGKIYQLWLITADAKYSAGTFRSAAAGEAEGVVTLPADSGSVLHAAVTDEPEGGSPQPTGSILLLGNT